MRVGVIAEGPADFAVVRSIIKAVLGLDEAEVDSIRPDLQSDETSRYAPATRAFSNWEIVKQECLRGRLPRPVRKEGLKPRAGGYARTVRNFSPQS